MHAGQPIDPALHIFASRLAYRLAGIVMPCLREDELHLLVTEYYKAIVADTQQFQKEKSIRRADG
jgi:hypothetical protein